ncbi:MAG: PaaI family thioesterase [Acidimicrobiales bacterium]
MTYPPDVHLLRDLAFTGTRSGDISTNTLAVTPGLCDEHGVRLGVLATMLDVSGAGIALHAIAPDWIATADLQAHLIRPVSTGTVAVQCRPLRVGARSIVVHAEMRDDDGVLCGTGRMAFARIPGSATKAKVEDVTDPETPRFSMDGGHPITDSVTERCGMEPVGPGQLRFDKTPYVENSFGTVNGGVLALAADAAAVSACGSGSARDLHIHYLEQIGAGPVGVTAEVIRDDESGYLCAVRIEDRADHRLVAIADVFVSKN